jgi:hypothetical protein
MAAGSGQGLPDWRGRRGRGQLAEEPGRCRQGAAAGLGSEDWGLNFGVKGVAAD